eukprot:s2062_g15.t1
MEASGEVAPGALKEARKLSRFFKYEPLKFIQAFTTLSAIIKKDLGMVDAADETVHAHLIASVGRWNAQEAPNGSKYEFVSVTNPTARRNCVQVKTSRFFEWAAKWTNLAPYWEFLRVVYDAWHVLKSREEAAPQASEQDEPERLDANEPQERQQRGMAREVHADLIQELRDKRKSRHTLDVVRDILHDGRVKLYASMLRGRSYQKLYVSFVRVVLQLACALCINCV